MQKGVNILLLCMLLACSNAVDMESSRVFTETSEEFLQAKTREDYLQVAARYESILDKGYESGALYYNLGNCYVKAGEDARAIAAYRRALRYRPRDPYLQANLQLALAGSEVKEERKVLEHIFFWQQWLSFPEKAQWFVILSTFTFVLAAMRLFVRQTKMFSKPLLLTFFGLSLLSAISLALDAYHFHYQRHGVIVADSVIARKGNSESYEAAFTLPLSSKTEFLVGEQRGDWVQILLPNQLEGWIPQDKALIY